MPWLIAYDIENDRLRTKTAARLIEHGFLRLQKSVFAGDPRETTLAAVEKWLQQNVPTGANSPNRVLLLPCTQAQLDRAKIFGSPPDDWDELLDPPNTLII